MRDYALKEEPFSKKVLRQIPKAFTAAVLLLSVLPVSFGGYASVRAPLIFIPLFYWLIFRPYSFSAFAAFLFGLAADFLENAPLGVNSLILLAFFVFASSQRRFLTNKPFAFVWVGFGLISLSCLILKWLVVSIWYARFLPFSLTFVSWLLLFLLYPFVAWVCAKLHIYLLEKEND